MVKVKKIGITEKETTYDSRYPENQVTATSNGLIVELDDTTGNTRYHVFHPSGSFFEMQHIGDMVHKTVGDSYQVTYGNNNIQIRKSEDKAVKGDLNLLVKGQSLYVTEGEFQSVNLKGYTVSVGENYKSIVAGDKTDNVAKTHRLNANAFDIRTSKDSKAAAPVPLASGTFKVTAKKMSLDNGSGTFYLESANAKIKQDEVFFKTGNVDVKAAFKINLTASSTIVNGNFVVNG